MNNKIITTFKHSLVYSLPNFFSKFVGFILLPLLTTYLLPREYGIWIIFEVSINFFSQLLTFGQPGAYLRYYYQYKDDLRKNEFFSSQFFFLLFISFAFLLLVCIDINYFIYFTSKPYLFKQLILFSAVIVIIRSFNNLFLSDLRAQQSVKFYSLLQILQSLLLLIFTWIFLKNIESKIFAIFYGHLISVIFVFFILLIRVLIKRVRFVINLDDLKNALQYGWPLIFGSIGWMLLNMGDRYVLKYLTNYQQTGLYGFAYKIGQLPFYFIVQPFLVAYHPLAFKWYEREKDTEYFIRIFIYIPMILMLISLPLILWADKIVQILTPKQLYWETYSTIGIITFGYLWTAATQIVNIAYRIKKKTKVVALLSLGIALLNILLNFVLIPIYGYRGAAIATALSFLLQFFISYRLAHTIFPIPYNIQKYILMVVIWSCIVLINQTITINSIVELIIVRTILFILFPVILYKFHYFGNKELSAVRRLIIKS